MRSPPPRTSANRSANFFSSSIAGIKLTEFPPVFESNPLLLCKFKLKEIIYIVCHEIDHVVLNHPAEMVKANPEGNPDTFYQFNLAADAAVNDRINHEIVAEKHGFMSEPDGLITSQVLSKMFKLGNIRQMENYAYYFGLIGKKSGQQQQGPGTAQNGQQSIMEQQNQKDGTSSSGGQGENEDEQNTQNDQRNSATEGQDEDRAGSGENGNEQVVTAANC